MKKVVIINTLLLIFIFLFISFVFAQDYVECSGPIKNYYEKATNCIGDVCKTDYCKDSKTLVEYYIEPEGIIIPEGYCFSSADIFSEEYDCYRECKDGACVLYDEDKLDCSESDTRFFEENGKNPFVKGTTCIGDTCMTDFCSGDSLTEYYLEEEGKLHFFGENICHSLTDIFSEEYKCSGGCEDGACNTVVCTDDGGRNYYEKGITRLGVGKNEVHKEDYCLDENTLREYYLEQEAIASWQYDINFLCNPLADIFSVDYTCPNGCQNGECFISNKSKLCYVDISSKTGGGKNQDWVGEADSFNECVELTGKEFLESKCKENPDIESTIIWGPVVVAGLSCPPARECYGEFDRELILGEPTKVGAVCKQTVLEESRYLSGIPQICESNPGANWEVWWAEREIEEGQCPMPQKCEIQQIKRLTREKVVEQENTSISECMDFLNDAFPNECEDISDGSLLIAKWGDVDLFRELCPGEVINRFLSRLRGLFI